ncbi:hypothetical protein [Streptomyces sp. V2]|uniref:hypothetical protein n=1 Tax=Streptomyces sp. V2 TaxID=1424099 RepID=UPI0019D12ADC|nr:hypothetical protein [Streptomyces sp. V2]
MAAVVVVHGVGQQYLGPRSLHTGIAAALADGVALAGGPPLTADDVGVAFYGHRFRPPGRFKGEPALTHRDVTDPLERTLLMEWWREAARLEPERVPAPDGETATKAITPQTVQRALYALARTRFAGRSGDRFLLGVLRQVSRYFTEPELRTRVRESVADAVADDTRVLVGHSLGSVVAYEALCEHPEWPVRTLVTIGSPLGIPTIVFDRLTPAPSEGRGTWPAGVRGWTNLCDRYDVVALRKRLAPLFGDVHDVAVDNGWQAHAIDRHLTAAETGTAIAEGLRRA